MLECVPNVSEGRDHDTIRALAQACGPALLHLQLDPDHHRSVFTLASEHGEETVAAARSLALAVAEQVDLSRHSGAHPRMGALDVVPFVALADTDPRDAILAARDFAEWVGDALSVPVFPYEQADPGARTLPETRRDAFGRRTPDVGPEKPHRRLGAVAVGARAPLVAVNLELESDDVALARRIADAVRERGGALPGVRALGFDLASREHAQVSMNLVDVAATSLETACTEVRARAEAAGTSIARVEIVGLIPRAEYERTSPEFRTWAEITEDQTIEARFAAG